jgi:hypothetical protein
MKIVSKLWGGDGICVDVGHIHTSNSSSHLAITNSLVDGSMKPCPILHSKSWMLWSSISYFVQLLISIWLITSELKTSERDIPKRMRERPTQSVSDVLTKQ